MDTDTALSVLNEPRVRVLEYLTTQMEADDTTPPAVPLDDVAAYVAAHTPTMTDDADAEVLLFQTAVPRLEQYGFLTFDEGARTITPRVDATAVVDAYHQLIDAFQTAADEPDGQGTHAF